MKSPSLPSERSFGFLFTVVFGLLAAQSIYSASSFVLTLTFAVATILLLVVTVIAPRRLSQLNKVWFKLGILLGKIFSPIILGAIFFILITPVALVARMLGRDELRIKKQKTKSFWVERDPTGPQPESFKNQF